FFDVAANVVPCWLIGKPIAEICRDIRNLIIGKCVTESGHEGSWFSGSERNAMQDDIDRIAWLRLTKCGAERQRQALRSHPRRLAVADAASTRINRRSGCRPLAWFTRWRGVVLSPL